MPRRPLSSCQEFRTVHAEFVDGLLTPDARDVLEAHRAHCVSCRAYDVRVRRSLLALQALPLIQPSAAFREALRRRLAASAAEDRAGTEVAGHAARFRMHSGSIRRIHTA